MTRHNPALDETPLSVFEALVRQLAAVKDRPVVPLHQGKTAFTTPVDLRPWGREEFEVPHYHDGPTCGSGRLLDAIAHKLGEQFGFGVATERIQVTAGITHALSVACHVVLQPGDEVLVLSPQWLFANGVIRAAGGVPVEVPFFPTRALRSAVAESMPAIRERLDKYRTPRTRALYFNSPNNPTGAALSRAQLGDLVDYAREHDLWILADNAYEIYGFEDPFLDPTQIEGGADRTFSAWSFSKTFGLTGYRIGYLTSPPSMAERARKFALHSIYSVPTCAQFVALSALRSPSGQLESHRVFVRTAMEITRAELRVPFVQPGGGFYVFLDLAGWPGGADRFVDACIGEGVSLAPGRAFGRHCADHARLCHSVVEHEALRAGIETINRVWSREMDQTPAEPGPSALRHA